ncbi:hypothetical protein RFI_14940 [Reticulomyxa filosa]|uniref:RING-type domain-containing protein n=1 Tax=Reticulomyxa filosa TaxID=46433 RepID=X6NAB9_RETFI|nr:hypothetical protein RFI_14940 [Reticulomyxa filosa]|eukprot:ETO22257.1 hypothetical protein RFI_14940 [Reticulomyxa filosa]
MSDIFTQRLVATAAAEKEIIKILEVLNGDLRCPICRGLFDDPQTLPCSHSYCLKCIKNLQGSDKTSIPKCPQCRRAFTRRQCANDDKLKQLTDVFKELWENIGSDCSLGPLTQCTPFYEDFSANIPKHLTHSVTSSRMLQNAKQSKIDELNARLKQTTVSQSNRNANAPSEGGSDGGNVVTDSGDEKVKMRTKKKCINATTTKPQQKPHSTDNDHNLNYNPNNVVHQTRSKRSKRAPANKSNENDIYVQADAQVSSEKNKSCVSENPPAHACAEEKVENEAIENTKDTNTNNPLTWKKYSNKMQTCFIKKKKKEVMSVSTL